MSLYERIKEMSIEEMAVFLADEIPHGDCYGCGMCYSTNTPQRMNDCCQEAYLKMLESEDWDDGKSEQDN